MATLTESLPAHQQFAKQDPEALQNKVPETISAYYSLVFPNFTYYIQTLQVAIGRRCVPNSTASSSDNPQVDVDLGSLKSVSRLHAKIEYEDDEERFMLHVLGRNGAWVDGVWSGSGSKVPLGDRSQIQIASRTFHFVLPPPPAPEDSPSPSSHSSTGNRARSPSVDITSISPPSSIPPCSPPPTHATSTQPKIPPLPDPQLPNSNTIRAKLNPKKRKKADIDAPPRPEEIPPKPQLTYAQLCYRAIKGLSGRGSLQEICLWIQDAFEYYKYSDKDWESSVRHNLSSNRAFKKLERGPDEKGKGALWTIDPQHEHLFEEQERRQAQAAAGPVGGKDGKSMGKKGKSPLDPPLKRSVKGDKSTPLPPPLTSVPLVPKSAILSSSQYQATGPLLPNSTVKSEPSPFTLSSGSNAGGTSTSTTASTTPVPTNAPSTTAQSSVPSLPASVKVPIIVGPVPSSSEPSSKSQPMVLHDNTLILSPEVFSHLTPQQIKDLESLGVQKAIEILQKYIVSYYKEKFKTSGRGRGKPRRGRGATPSAGRGGPTNGNGRDDGTPSALFTTTPLPSRTIAPPPPLPSEPVAESAPAMPPMASLQLGQEDSTEDIIIVDDDPVDDYPSLKRRRVDSPGGSVAS